MAFLAAAVTEITEVKRPRLQQWMDLGYIKPSVESATGHGSRNQWSREDLYKIAIFKKIAESGLSRKVAADLIKSISIGDHIVKPGFCLWYVRNRGESRIALTLASSRDHTLQDMLEEVGFDHPSFDDCYIVNIDRIVSAIDKKIKNR